MKGRDSAERFRRSRRGSGRTREREEAAPDSPRFSGLPVIVGALIGALVLGFLILRYSAANAMLQLGPQMAAEVTPRHPAVVLANAFEELQLGGDVSDATERAAMGAFADAPLSEVPLLIAARKAIAAGDEVKAARLIAIAVRRNPRSRYALLLRLDQQVRLNRIDEAAETMALLSRSFPDAQPLLTAQLAAMAADPDTRDAARRAMASDSGLRLNVLEQLARRGADPEVILSLAGNIRPAAPGAPVPDWQRLLIDNMVERGRVVEAHQIWLRFTGANERVGGIYDADFAGLPGLPPFNWNFETGSNGYAERGNGGLEVQYDGRANARLAAQLLVLPPGEYRISFSAEGDASGDEGQLAWTVTCHPRAPEGLSIPIIGVEGAPKPFSATFTVPPARCPGQWLRLVGRSAEFPEDQQVTIRQLRVEGVGGR